MGRDMTIDDRVWTLYGWLVALAAGGGILFFWLIGTILLFTGNGGYIQHLHLTDGWRLLYLGYPVVFAGAVLIGLVLAGFRRDVESLAFAGLPVVAALVFYFAMVHFR